MREYQLNRVARPWIYNPRYGYRAERPIPPTRIEQDLQREQRRVELRLQRLTQRYQRGSLPLEQYQLQFARQIRAAHLSAAMVAVGGADRMTPEYLAIVNEALAEEYRYLEGFSRELADYEGIGARAAFLPFLRVRQQRRARSYASAMMRTFAYIEWRVKIAEGFRFGWRSLSPRTEHCPECPALKTDGWVGIQSITPRGWDCSCRNHCKCQVKYRR